MLVLSRTAYSLHHDVCFVETAFISAEQPNTHPKFGIGLYGHLQLQYSLFAILTFGS